MPNDTRVKPPSRSRASPSAVTLSGLASVVTSAPRREPELVVDEPQQAHEVVGRQQRGRPAADEDRLDRTDGSPSTCRASRTSAAATSAYVAWLTRADGPPSSSAV